jgi:hypothetical protein
VFTSYTLQIGLIACIWAGLVISAVFRRQKRSRQIIQDGGNNSGHPHHAAWVHLLLEFHKAQCYFCCALMIAAYSYGVSDVDSVAMLMLIPLTLNGVLPITFGYFLLCRYKRPILGIAILTFPAYMLSTFAFWNLYTGLRPVMDGTKLKYGAYVGYMLEFSAIPTCGGFSALSVCPDTLLKELDSVREAAKRVYIFAPIIWGISTLVLCTLCGSQLRRWHNDKQRGQEYTPELEDKQLHPSSSSFIKDAVFWCTSMIFIGIAGMQLSLLYIFLSLNMMDPTDWSFGQIVAVTIWSQPLLEYLYALFSKLLIPSIHVQMMTILPNTYSECCISAVGKVQKDATERHPTTMVSRRRRVLNIIL